MVIDRVGSVEAQWSKARLADAEMAASEALLRLGLLQKALRRRLLDEARPIRLNSKDPVGANFDFSDLDAMAEILWRSAA